MLPPNPRELLKLVAVNYTCRCGEDSNKVWISMQYCTGKGILTQNTMGDLMAHQFKSQQGANPHQNKSMTTVSPPDAKLSAIGQWVWLIPLKAAVSVCGGLPDSSAANLYCSRTLRWYSIWEAHSYASWGDLLGLFSHRSRNKGDHWQGWEILPQRSGGCTRTIIVVDKWDGGAMIKSDKEKSILPLREIHSIY